MTTSDIILFTLLGYLIPTDSQVFLPQSVPPLEISPKYLVQTDEDHNRQDYDCDEDDDGEDIL